MNRANLEKLAAYLEALPADYQHFDMFDFYLRPQSIYVAPSKSLPPFNCGAVACAVGHGPAAGIEPLEHEDWTAYGNRVFEMAHAEWAWCFSDKWTSIDNTPLGAAKRIRHLIEHGLPENYDEQMRDYDPYMFAEEAA